MPTQWQCRLASALLALATAATMVLSPAANAAPAFQAQDLGVGWKVLGGLSGNVGALGIDQAGDALAMANHVCPSAWGLSYAVAGGSTVCFDDLVLGSGWSFQSLSARGAIAPGWPGGADPAAGTRVGLGDHLASGSWRIARLTRSGELPPPPATTLSAQVAPWHLATAL
jgi:hypothetical protein